MALNSQAKRMASVGVGRPYMRATLAGGVKKIQRYSIGNGYFAAGVPVTVSLVGQEITVEQGAVTIAAGETNVSIAGQEIAVEQGSITAVGDANVSIAGQESTVEQGVIIAVGKVNLILTGQQLTAQQGVIIVNIATDALPSVSFSAIKPQRGYNAVKPQRDYNAAKVVNIL